MSASGAGHSGEGAGNAIKKGVGIVHGAGEAIRGNINAFADSAVGSKEGMAKDRNIVDRGVDEMNTGHYHGTGAGVTPVDTARERQNRVAQGEFDNSGAAYSGSTARAPHQNHVAQGGYDNSGAYSGNTARGPHQSSMANKVDPTVDSEFDNPERPRLRKSVTWAVPMTLEYFVPVEETMSTWDSYLPYADTLMVLQSTANTVRGALNTQNRSTEMLVAPLTKFQAYGEALKERSDSFDLDAPTPAMQRLMQNSPKAQKPALVAFEHYLNKTVLTPTQKESLLVKQREIDNKHDKSLANLERFVVKPLLGPRTLSPPPKEPSSERPYEISTTPNEALNDHLDLSFHPQPNKFEQQIARLIYNATLAKVESWEAEAAAGKSLSEIWHAERAEKGDRAARKRAKRYSRHSNKLMDRMDPRVHRVHASSPCPNEDCTEGPPSVLSTFKSLVGTIKRWSKVPRIRWGCYLMSTLVVPLPIPGALLVLEAVQWGGWQVWDDDFWNAMVELMMGQVEEERALADGRPERGMVEQMSMLSPPLESLAEEDEDEGQDGTSMVSPLLESLILETAEQNATEDEVVKGVMVVEREVEDVEEEGEVPNKIREDAKEEGSRLCNNALPHP